MDLSEHSFCKCLCNGFMVHFIVCMFRKLDRSLGTARGTYSAAFRRECNKEGVLTAVAVYPGGAMGKDAAIEIFVEDFGNLVS